MRVIVSQTENRWRYWLKLEDQQIFSSKTPENEPLDLRKIKWIHSSVKKIQKTHNGLYEKLVEARRELDGHTRQEINNHAAPISLEPEDIMQCG